MNRNVIIDILKGIAILLVVYGHVIQIGMGNNEFWSNEIFIVIYSFHMPLFIFISGYVSAYGNVKRNFVETLKKRFNSLFIPFISWAIVMYVYLLMGNFILKSPGESNLFNYMLNVIINPGNGLWFLWVLLILDILFTGIIKLTPKRKIIISIIVYVVILAIPLNEVFYWYMIKWLYPFYFVGALLFMYKEKLANLFKPISIILGIIFPILILFWDKNDYVYISRMVFPDDFLSNVINFTYRYLIAFCGIAVTYYFAKVISRLEKLVLILKQFGRYTIDLYAIQMFLLLILSHLPIVTNATFFNIIYVPIVSLFISLLSVLLSKYIIRKIPFFSRVLLGGR